MRSAVIHFSEWSKQYRVVSAVGGQTLHRCKTYEEAVAWGEANGWDLMEYD